MTMGIPESEQKPAGASLIATDAAVPPLLPACKWHILVANRQRPYPQPLERWPPQDAGPTFHAGALCLVHQRLGSLQGSLEDGHAGQGLTSYVHKVIVRVENRTAIGIYGGGSHCKLVHARLAKDDAIGIQQPRHQRRAVAGHPACAVHTPCSACCHFLCRSLCGAHKQTEGNGPRWPAHALMMALAYLSMLACLLQ